MEGVIQVPFIQHKELTIDQFWDYFGKLYPIDKRRYHLLFNLSLSTPQGYVLETGTYEGGSTIAMALGSKITNNGKVITIDKDKGSIGLLSSRDWWESGANRHERLLHNLMMTGLSEWIILINCNSTIANDFIKPDLPVRLLYVDGGHGYDIVLHDFTTYGDMVVSGGYVVFHDYHSDLRDEGTYRVVHEVLEPSIEWTNMEILPAIMSVKAMKV